MKNQTTILCGAGYVSGKEIMALELAGGLRDVGFPVDVICSSWNNGDFVNRLKKAGLTFRTMRLGFISATMGAGPLWMTANQVLHWPGLLNDYRRMLETAAPAKIVHTNWHHLLLLWPFLNPARDFFWLHESIPDTPRYRRVFGALQHRLHRFIAVSHSVAASLAGIGIAADKIEVIHNGLADPAGTETPEPYEGKGLRVGIIGQVSLWKGHTDVVEALAIAAQNYPAIELHVIGTGSPNFATELKQRAAELGIAARITWHGFIQDRKAIYRNLDICVVPSRSNDPLPTVAIEAGFYSLPVIATRRGGLPEIVLDGVTGFLVEAGEPAELAERIQRLAGDTETRRTMGRSARNHVTAAFGRERFLLQFKQCLDFSI